MTLFHGLWAKAGLPQSGRNSPAPKKISRKGWIAQSSSSSSSTSSSLCSSSSSGSDEPIRKKRHILKGSPSIVLHKLKLIIDAPTNNSPEIVSEAVITEKPILPEEARCISPEIASTRCNQSLNQFYLGNTKYMLHNIHIALYINIVHQQCNCIPKIPIKAVRLLSSNWQKGNL